VKCFARWYSDCHGGASFRDQTILQFGDSWEFRASFVLLNPGSALPLNESDQTDWLRDKDLPFFVSPKDGEKYVQFSVDRLMRDVMTLFSAHFSGGAIRLHNLFNLKNQDSADAVDQIAAYSSHPKMFAKDADIRFCHAPVIVASGGYSENNDVLRAELIRLVRLARLEFLFALSRIAPRSFSILQATPNGDGFVKSYHPSYTFKYGNTTTIGEIQT